MIGRHVKHKGMKKTLKKKMKERTKESVEKLNFNCREILSTPLRLAQLTRVCLQLHQQNQHCSNEKKMLFCSTAL